MPLYLDAFSDILRTGAPWRELSAQYGLWSTVYSQFRRWCLCGVWDVLVVWFGGQAKGLLRHVDEDGLLCGFVLCAGNLHDLAAARLMLESFRGTHLVGDKGFGSLALRQEILEHGATDSTIPRKGYQTLDEQPRPFDRENDAKRHLVETSSSVSKRTNALRCVRIRPSRFRWIHRFRRSPGQNSPGLICEDTA